MGELFMLGQNDAEPSLVTEYSAFGGFYGTFHNSSHFSQDGQPLPLSQLLALL